MGEQRSNPATTENLQKHQKVTAVVELIKDDYLVLSLPDQGNAICFASTGDYNLQVKDAHQRYQPGQRYVCCASVVVLQTISPWYTVVDN
jgi:rRNA biogenesis protein RRP5